MCEKVEGHNECEEAAEGQGSSWNLSGFFYLNGNPYQCKNRSAGLVQTSGQKKGFSFSKYYSRIIILGICFFILWNGMIKENLA